MRNCDTFAEAYFKYIKFTVAVVWFKANWEAHVANESLGYELLGTMSAELLHKVR